MNAKVSSQAADRALKRLGAQLKTARIKRRISMKGFAERIGASQSTVARLEKGDAGVSIGTLAMACLVLGEIDRISEFLDPATDDTGLSLDQVALPKRIRTKRITSESSTIKNKQSTPSEGDVDGVGF
jgi:transcriptional regulator with XRE-family HTH domain